MIRGRKVASLAVVFLVAALTTLPIAEAQLPVETYWSGSSTAYANCSVIGQVFSAGSMTVTWSISFSTKTDTYSWGWTTSYNWVSKCGNVNVQLVQGCGGLIVPGSQSVSLPDSGSGSSSAPPKLTVAPISVATYDMFCLSLVPPGWSFGPMEFSMQAAATIQT